jgi:hypothetical protein
VKFGCLLWYSLSTPNFTENRCIVFDTKQAKHAQPVTRSLHTECINTTLTTTITDQILSELRQTKRFRQQTGRHKNIDSNTFLLSSHHRTLLFPFSRSSYSRFRYSNYNIALIALCVTSSCFPPQLQISVTLASTCGPCYKRL